MPIYERRLMPDAATRRCRRRYADRAPAAATLRSYITMRFRVTTLLFISMPRVDYHIEPFEHILLLCDAATLRLSEMLRPFFENTHLLLRPLWFTLLMLRRAC